MIDVKFKITLHKIDIKLFCCQNRAPPDKMGRLRKYLLLQNLKVEVQAFTKCIFGLLMFLFSKLQVHDISSKCKMWFVQCTSRKSRIYFGALLNTHLFFSILFLITDKIASDKFNQNFDLNTRRCAR